MISIELNNCIFLVKSNLSVIEACKFLGVAVPRFCYHEKLSVAASCRMCIVEIEKSPKPVTACSTDISSNMVIYTNTPFVKKARENILEALLLNHPLDCPICDQAGECDLQDQVKIFGSSHSRFYYMNKRTVEDKNCGPLIKTIMTRCIHCTRCVRFGSEIAGVDYLGTLNRGVSTEIGGYISKLFDSEISGNVIDLCPVGSLNKKKFFNYTKTAKGALTANSHAFKMRPWEIKTVDSIDTSDSLGSNIFINFKEQEVVRVLPKINEKLNENWISDKTRFGFDALEKNRLQNPIRQINKNEICAVSFMIENELVPEESKSSADFLSDCVSFLKKKSLNSIVCNWTRVCISFFLAFSKQLKTLKNTQATFIVNENIDLELLVTLTVFQKTNRNVNLCSIENSNKKENFHSFWRSDKISKIGSEIKKCFLFTTNIKVENTLLNIKLQTKSLTKNFHVLSFGLNSKNTYSTTCLNLHFKNIVDFLEAKQSISSQHVTNYRSPLFFFGDSFNSRSSISSTILINFIKINFPSAICINLKGKSNTSSLEFLNVRRLNKNKVLKSSSLAFYNLDANLKLKKVLKDLQNKTDGIKNFFWFNNYKSNLFESFENQVFYIPTLNSLEFKGSYLNLEERPQQTQTLKTNFIPSLKTFVEYFLAETYCFDKSEALISIGKSEFLQTNFTYKSEKLLDLQFLFESIRTNNLFDSTQQNFNLQLNKSIYFKTYSKYFKYPFKSAIDDFYLTDIYSENSSMMVKSSREFRKLTTNF